MKKGARTTCAQSVMPMGIVNVKKQEGDRIIRNPLSKGGFFF
jgi:hypothetical protein